MSRTRCTGCRCRYFDSRQRGEVLSRVTNDVDNIQTSLSMTISQLLTSVLTVVAVLVMMLTISPLLTLITVRDRAAVAVVDPGDRAALAAAVRRAVAQHRPAQRPHRGDLQRLHRGQDVRSPGQRPQEQFREFNDDVYHASFGAQFFSGLVSPATTFVGNLELRGGGGGRRRPGRRPGQITLGSIQAFIQYVRQFNQPLTQVAGMYNTLQSGVASAERVFDLLDAEEESPDPARDAAVPRRRSARPGRVPARELQLPARHTGDRRPVTGGRTGQHGGDRRADRRGQDDAGESADAVLRRRLRPHSR